LGDLVKTPIFWLFIWNIAMTTYGRYLACSICDDPILVEKNGFTSLNGNVSCQRCGLEAILTPRQWSTIFSIQSGGNVIMARKSCSTLRTFPATIENEESIVEFSSPSGEKFCIVRIKE
jgi:hypothetical protein